MQEDEKWFHWSTVSLDNLQMEDKLQVPEKSEKVDFEKNMIQYFGKSPGTIIKSNCAYNVNIFFFLSFFRQKTSLFCRQQIIRAVLLTHYLWTS